MRERALAPSPTRSHWVRGPIGSLMLLALVCSAGCAGQSRREALEIICETPNHVDMEDGREPFAVLHHIGSQVTNQEIGHWYVHALEDENIDYGQQLRDMASTEGVRSCPFAAYLRR